MIAEQVAAAAALCLPPIRREGRRLAVQYEAGTGKMYLKYFQLLCIATQLISYYAEVV